MVHSVAARLQRRPLAVILGRPTGGDTVGEVRGGDRGGAERPERGRPCPGGGRRVQRRVVRAVRQRHRGRRRGDAVDGVRQRVRMRRFQRRRNAAAADALFRLEKKESRAGNSCDRSAEAENMLICA